MDIEAEIQLPRPMSTIVGWELGKPIISIISIEWVKLLMNQLQELLDFQMMVANFQFFVGLAYAEPSVISHNMHPLRGTISGSLDKGCAHRIIGIRNMYTSAKPQIVGFFELLDRYIAGEVSRDRVIELCTQLQNINLKKPAEVKTQPANVFRKGKF